jgi:branched-subunit amino acid ABC-type transport system permease component
MSAVISFFLQTFYQYAANISLLTLSAIGLMVIFGVMGVINMAQGELMMIGAYSTSYTYSAGLPLPLAIVSGAVGGGVAGLIIERLIVRRFYENLLMSLVVTFGLSLVISQGALLLFGPSVSGVPTPRGNFSYRGYTYSTYNLITFGVSLGMITATWLLLTKTKFGIRTRATMEDADTARALGVRIRLTYAVTFSYGAMLAGLAGGMLAATSTIGPTFGAEYTPLAFITVVVGGGANIVTGLVTSVLALGGVRGILVNQSSVLVGYVGMLVTAFVVIRFMPDGVSEYLEQRRVRARALITRRVRSDEVDGL